MEEVETNNKIKSIRDFHGGIRDFKKGYQPRSTIVKDEKGNYVCRLQQCLGWVEELFLPAIECTWG